MQPYDLLIAGAGPVGLSLALALKDSGLDIALVDARDAAAGAADPRVLALAHGTKLTLERFGIWNDLSPRPTPIQSIHISHQGGFGRTLLHAHDYDLTALGHVSAAGALSAALRAAVDRAGIEIMDNTRLSDLTPDDHSVCAHLEPAQGDAVGATRRARLIVCAEGGLGAGEQGINEHDYDQHALIATLSTEGGHTHRAFERFTSEGPIALLPYRDGFALVHVCAPAHAEELLTLDDDAYLRIVQTHLGSRVRLTGVSARLRYPLGLRYRGDVTGARTVWLGNAAQTLHPVAGQGFNLALRDVRALADILLKHPGDPGMPTTLDAYARARQLDRFSAIHFTDKLVRLFSNDIAPLKHLRGAGLFACDMLPPLRNFIARRMMFGARAWP